jgi:hypothetical protein
VTTEKTINNLIGIVGQLMSADQLMKAGRSRAIENHFLMIKTETEPRHQTEKGHSHTWMTIRM